MSIEILPIAEGHIEGFHAALDVVARERACGLTRSRRCQTLRV